MYLREVSFALSLSLCGGGWGVCGLRVGGGGWCFPFQGSLGGFPSEGSRMGLPLLAEAEREGMGADYWKPRKPLNASRGL